MIGCCQNFYQNLINEGKGIRRLQYIGMESFPPGRWNIIVYFEGVFSLFKKNKFMFRHSRHVSCVQAFYTICWKEQQEVSEKINEVENLQKFEKRRRTQFCLLKPREIEFVFTVKFEKLTCAMCFTCLKIINVLKNADVQSFPNQRPRRVSKTDKI